MQAPAQTQPAAPPRAPAPAPKVTPEFDALPIWKMEPSNLVALLNDPKSTLFQKAIACKKLSIVGGPDAVRPMAALLNHPKLACYARFGLEPNPDPSVDEAFRAALPKLKGKLQMGVIHSICFRKDAKSLDALKKLFGDSDVQVAGAAAAAVGMIGGLEAARILESAFQDTASPVFPVVARACLLCAEGLMAGNRSRALQLYGQLSAKSMPGPVQLAALRVLNAAGPVPAYTKPWTAPTGAAADADTSGFLDRRPRN